MILFEWSEDEASTICQNLGTHHNELILTNHGRLKLVHDGETVGDWDLNYLESLSAYNLEKTAEAQ